MELVQALEQLSLEVRNQKFNISTDCKALEEEQPIQYHPHYQNVYQSYRQHPLNQSNNSISTDDQHLRQLQEFDNSIETLFAQITELDCLEPKRTNQAPSLPNLAHSRRENFNYLHRNESNAHHSGSMETSQEDDSDCSSQRSGCANVFKKDIHINPLVKDLLKRDIRTITGTMRKISRILTIGGQLESLHNYLFNGVKNDIHTKFDDLNTSSLENIDLSYIRSLCDEFNSLCLSEQHIRDLPTIISYSEICCNLLAQLTRLEQNSNYIGYQAEHDDDDEISLRNTTGPIGVNDEYCDTRLSMEGDEGELDDDVAFLNCDQKHVDNWTENKLYINHSST